MSDDTGDYRTIKPVVASGMAEVRLYDETLSAIRSKHPELRSLPEVTLGDAIERAVATPDIIHQSVTQPNSVVFVSSTATKQDNPLVVPVKRIDGTSSGRVQTAYFGSGYPGSVVWRLDDEQSNA